MCLRQKSHSIASALASIEKSNCVKLVFFRDDGDYIGDDLLKEMHIETDNFNDFEEIKQSVKTILEKQK